MKIYCRGGTTIQKRLAKDIAKFCGEKTMSKRLQESLTVTIYFVDDLVDTDGDCMYEDDFDVARPKEFTIRVGNKGRSIWRQLRTVCHEMVHVKQYAKGEMKYMWRPARHTKFNGELYPDSLNYWEQPWEIEAFGREVGLYTRWVDDRGWTGNEIFDNRSDDDKVTQDELDFLGIKKEIKEIDQSKD